MERIITIICLLISYSSFAMQVEDVIEVDTVFNYVDSLGKKQGKWLITNDMVNKDCYAADQLVEEGFFKDSKKNNLWIQYFCNKNFKSKINYTNNRPNGHATIYHENGQVKEEGDWVRNRWIGAYKLYHSNGNVSQAFNFNKMGRREGLQEYFYENGQLMIEGVWDGGKESGLVKEYYSNGAPKSIKDFAGGHIIPENTQKFEPTIEEIETDEELAEDLGEIPEVVVEKDEKDNLNKVFNGEGYWQLYNKHKQVTKDGVFKKNKLIKGKAYYYSEDGILIRIAIFKRGRYIGDGPLDEESLYVR